jgi:hypothetical protein
VIGDQVTFELTPSADCYVLLVNLGTDGSLYVLFPNSFVTDNFVAAGERIGIPVPSSGWQITVGGPEGMEVVKAIATTAPIDFGGVPLEQLLKRQLYALPAEESGRVVQQLATEVLSDRPVGGWAIEAVSFLVSHDPIDEKDPLEMNILE